MADRKRLIRAGFTSTALTAAILGATVAPAGATTTLPSAAATPAGTAFTAYWSFHGPWESLDEAEAKLQSWIQRCLSEGGQYQGSVDERTTAKGKQYQAWLDCQS